MFFGKERRSQTPPIRLDTSGNVLPHLLGGLTRRQMLKVSAAVAASGIFAACAPQTEVNTPTITSAPKPPENTPTPITYDGITFEMKTLSEQQKSDFARAVKDYEEKLGIEIEPIIVAELPLEERTENGFSRLMWRNDSQKLYVNPDYVGRINIYHTVAHESAHFSHDKKPIPISEMGIGSINLGQDLEVTGFVGLSLFASRNGDSGTIGLIEEPVADILAGYVVGDSYQPTYKHAYDFIKPFVDQKNDARRQADNDIPFEKDLAKMLQTNDILGFVAFIKRKKREDVVSKDLVDVILKFNELDEAKFH